MTSLLIDSSKMNSAAGYHRFHHEDGMAYGSFEVFWEDGAIGDPGWYWWPCYPECIPEAEPTGPFRYSTEAQEDADPNWASLNLTCKDEEK